MAHVQDRLFAWVSLHLRVVSLCFDVAYVVLFFVLLLLFLFVVVFKHTTDLTGCFPEAFCFRNVVNRAFFQCSEFLRRGLYPSLEFLYFHMGDTGTPESGHLKKLRHTLLDFSE